jgi:hypothetical protein
MQSSLDVHIVPRAPHIFDKINSLSIVEEVGTHIINTEPKNGGGKWEATLVVNQLINNPVQLIPGRLTGGLWTYMDPLVYHAYLRAWR